MELYLKSFKIFIIAYLEKGVDALYNVFTIPGSAFYIPSFILFIVLAFIPFYLSKNKTFLKYVFPKEVYLHPSSIMDMKLLLINTLVRPVGFIFFIFSVPWLTDLVFNALPEPSWQRLEGGNLLAFACAFIGFIVSDLVVFITHYMEHKIKLLWRVHSLHHSAEVLTPFTLYRNHPLQNIYGTTISWAVFGVTNGLLLYLTAKGATVEMIMNHQLPYIFFRGVLGNFHHSHMWLSFGKLSYLFVSPAMHQIHHSYDPKHHNKNIGNFLSIWDYLFGTLYIPKHKEELKMGITPENPNPHKTLKDAYLKL